MRLVCPTVCFLLLVAGCSDPEPRPEPGPLSPSASEVDRNRAAQPLMDAFQARLDALAGLPPAERWSRQLALGPDLERLALQVTGSRFENKALYLLADWRMAFHGGRGVEEALERLERCRSAALKPMGRMLRVELLLREGRLAQAEIQAQALATDLPEAQGLLELVALHRRRGTPAPPALALDPTGRRSDPVAERPAGSAILCLFLPRLDDQACFLAQRHQLALRSAGKADRCLVAVLVADASARILEERSPQLPGVLLRWAADRTMVETWTQDWGLPGGTGAVLVGADGRIAGVQPYPEELAALLP